MNNNKISTGNKVLREIDGDYIEIIMKHSLMTKFGSAMCRANQYFAMN